MTVAPIQAKVFGTYVDGVRVEMSKDEAKAIMKMIAQGFAHPPKVPGTNNDDWEVRKIGGELFTQLQEITR